MSSNGHKATETLRLSFTLMLSEDVVTVMVGVNLTAATVTMAVPLAVV